MGKLTSLEHDGRPRMQKKAELEAKIIMVGVEGLGRGRG